MKTGETYGPIKGVDEDTQPEHNLHEYIITSTFFPEDP